MSISICALPTEAVPAAMQKVYAHDEFQDLCKQPDAVEFYFARDPAYQIDGHGYYTWRSIWPELNLSQTNAQAIMMIVGIDARACDWVGEVSVAKLPGLRTRILWAMNSVRARSKAVRKEEVWPNFVNFELSDDQIALRLKAFLDVVCFAQMHALAVGWS